MTMAEIVIIAACLYAGYRLIRKKDERFWY
nr:MAG TPA: FeoB-associated Cys-rich membrane protein [Caudoviricetes sp.]